MPRWYMSFHCVFGYKLTSFDSYLLETYISTHFLFDKKFDSMHRILVFFSFFINVTAELIRGLVLGLRYQGERKLL